MALDKEGRFALILFAIALEPFALCFRRHQYFSGAKSVDMSQSISM